MRHTEHETDDRQKATERWRISGNQVWLLTYYESVKDPKIQHVWNSYRLTGYVDGEILQRSIRMLLTDHQVLRSRFWLGHHEAEVIPSSIDEFRLLEYDLRAREGASALEEARRITRNIVETHFVLENAPLVRSALIRLSDDQSIWTLACHHAVCDGASLAIAVREIKSNYTRHLNGHGSLGQETPRRIQFPEYVESIEAWIKTAPGVTSLEYWRRKLRGLRPPLFMLPTDDQATFDVPDRQPSLVFDINPSQLLNIRKKGQHAKVTTSMWMAACTMTLLLKVSKSNDLLLAMVNAGRRNPIARSMIGWLAETWLLRLSLSEQDTFATALEKVKATSLEATPYIDAPYARVRDNLIRDVGLSAFPQLILFNYITNYSRDETFCGEQNLNSGASPLVRMTDLDWVLPERTIDDRAGIKVFITFVERQNAATCFIQHTASLYQREFATSFAGMLSRLIGRTAEDPNVRVGELI